MSATGNAPRIQVIGADGSRRPPVELTPAGLVIGRETGVDVLLSDPQVSRKHARITWDGRQVLVTDLGSSNGSFLGSERLLPHEPRVWPPGTWLRIDSWILQLEMPGARPDDVSTSSGAFESVIQTTPPGTLPPTNPIVTPAGQPSTPPAPSPSSRIRVIAEPNTLSITPGQPVSARVTLANTGQTVDHLRISIEGVPADWVQGHEREVQLNPGGQITVPITVNVARSAANRSGQYPVTIRATSRENPGESGAAPALWTVLPYTMSALTISPMRALGKRDANYTLTVRNDSNAASEFEMSGSDDEEVLRYRFDPPSVFLEPGESQTVPLSIRTKKRWVGSTLIRRFTIRARNMSGTGGQPQTVNGEFGHQAMMPVWVPVAVLTLLVAGAVLAYNIISRTPDIGNFSYSPTALETGQYFTVSWETKRADSVEIRNFMPRTSQPSGTFEFPNGLQENTQLTLIARNRWGESRETITVQVIAPEPTPTPEPGAPNILLWDVQPRRIMAGESVTITWQIENVQDVNISVFGTESASGERTHQPSQTTSYTLTASNPGVTPVVRIIEVVVVQPQATQPPTGPGVQPTVPQQATMPPAQPGEEPTATMPEEPTPTEAPTPAQGGGGPLVLDGDIASEVVGASNGTGVFYALAGNRIYRSADGGATWELRGPAPEGRLAVSFNNPDLLYIGDHAQGCTPFDSLGTIPLQVSMDGGASWQQIANDVLGIRPFEALDEGSATRILGSDCRLVYSQDSGELFAQVDGMTNFDAMLWDLALQPGGFDQMAVSYLSTDGNETGQVTLFDIPTPQNAFFDSLPVPSGPGPLVFFYGRAVLDWQSNILVIATPVGIFISDSPSGGYYGPLILGLEDVTYRGEEDFEYPLQIGDIPDDEFGKPAGFNDVVIDPTNPNRIWLAGVEGVYLSNNLGQSWSKIIDESGVQSIAVSIEQNLLFVTAFDQTKVWTLDGN